MKNKIFTVITIVCLLTLNAFSAHHLEAEVMPDQKKKTLLNSLIADNATKSKSTSAAQQGDGLTSFVDISVILQAAAGGSTATDSEIAQLQTGAHDPRRRGFTFQGGEIAVSGTVDSNFRAEMYALFSESAVELEEAFFIADALPWNMEVELGYFLTEFGRNNPRHAHAADFIDQPVVIGRLFGSEGQRATGMRLGGVLSTSWFSEWNISMQSPVGGLTSSFRNTGTSTIAGRPTVTRDTQSFEDIITTLRLVNGTQIFGDWEMQFGLSAMQGANNTGTDSKTTMLGADLVFAWFSKKQKQGYPFARIEAEVIQRNFEAASGVQNGLTYSSEDIKDWGWIINGVYGFAHRWTGGLRYEQAGGEGASFTSLRSADSSRADRTRISPIVTFRPSEFSKVSLQGNFDKADHLTDKSQTSVWLAFEVLIGKHAAHNF